MSADSTAAIEPPMSTMLTRLMNARAMSFPLLMDASITASGATAPPMTVDASWPGVLYKNAATRAP